MVPGTIMQGVNEFCMACPEVTQIILAAFHLTTGGVMQTYRIVNTYEVQADNRAEAFGKLVRFESAIVYNVIYKESGEVIQLDCECTPND